MRLKIRDTMLQDCYHFSQALRKILSVFFLASCIRVLLDASSFLSFCFSRFQNLLPTLAQLLSAYVTPEVPVNANEFCFLTDFAPPILYLRIFPLQPLFPKSYLNPGKFPSQTPSLLRQRSCQTHYLVLLLSYYRKNKSRAERNQNSTRPNFSIQ